MSRLLLSIVCILSLRFIGCTQDTFFFRRAEGKNAELEGRPHKVLALQEGSLLALVYKTSAQASVGPLNLSYDYHMTAFDAATLSPKMTKKCELTAAWGKAAVEDIFEHKGQVYALITLQDKSANHLSINVSQVDMGTLQCGPLTEIFNDPAAMALPGGTDHEAQPLGLAISSDGDGWWIVDQPISCTDGSGGAKFAYNYSLHRDC